MAKSKRNWGKEIKDLGVLIIIIGTVMVLGVLYLFIDGSSELAKMLDDHILFLSVGGGIALIIGIIVRSIGRSKEQKFREDNEDK